MKYIQVTIAIPLILPIEKSGNINWYADAAVTVHENMGGHTGGFVAMVKRGSCIQSSNQKLNTKSSTGVDPVIVYDVLTQLMWTR